jgi:glycosyltransferase involved in cell wall biosynthesis
MKIGFFNYLYDRKRYGGLIYNQMALQALEEEHLVHSFRVIPWFTRAGKWPQQLLLTGSMTRRHPEIEVWIREPLAMAALTQRVVPGKNIGLVHHLPRTDGKWSGWRRPIGKLFLAGARKCDVVVTVSQFWREVLESLGVDDVRVIYNAFDLEMFDFTAEEVQRFRGEMGLAGKPIIYVGNAQEAKGANQVVDALQGFDAHLVTSGVQEGAIAARRFDLPYKEYLLLLAASDVVVTMSSFLEGWNRTAHEAMLCGTPVVGSGTGGMGELLKRGGQVVCSDPRTLRGIVRSIIADGTEVGREGQRFARRFGRGGFGNDWRQVIEDLS